MMRASLLLLCALVGLSACGHRPPEQTTDACLILEDNRAWWRALQRTEQRWGIPPGVQMAPGEAPLPGEEPLPGGYMLRSSSNF